MEDNPMASRSNGVITEIRTYRIKAGRREEFLQLFHASVAPLQRSKGITVVGPFRDIENSDTIVWLRTFPSVDDRERMLNAFYETDEWKSSLQEITGEMIEDKSQVLTLLPGWILNDPASP
jgi:quinol monooxygenase YgiN